MSTDAITRPRHETVPPEDPRRVAGPAGRLRGWGSLAAYAALTLALTWGVWVPALVLLGEQAMPVVMLGAFGPAAAAAIMVRAQGGRVRDWLRRIMVLRVRARWYVAALTLPLVAPAITSIGAVASGAPLTAAELPSRVPGLILGFVMALLLGGGQEELGWRGYLLPRLQSRLDPLLASLLIGLLWAVWHLPLFLLDMPGYTYSSVPFAVYVAVVVSYSVVFTWLFNHTGGSVALAMLLHAAINTWDGLAPVAASLQLGQHIELLGQMALAGAYGLIAAALVAACGTRLGALPRRRIGAQASRG